MAKKTPKKVKKALKKGSRPRPQPEQLTEHSNPLAAIDDGLRPNTREGSRDIIYESMMRGGGEPFGRPWGNGLSSLTDKIVKLFRQRSFFGFETLEHTPRSRRRNRFTRYAASRYHGNYQMQGAKRAWQHLTEDRKAEKKEKK